MILLLLLGRRTKRFILHSGCERFKAIFSDAALCLRSSFAARSVLCVYQFWHISVIRHVVRCSKSSSILNNNIGIHLCIFSSVRVLWWKYDFIWTANLWLVWSYFIAVCLFNHFFVQFIIIVFIIVSPILGCLYNSLSNWITLYCVFEWQCNT